MFAKKSISTRAIKFIFATAVCAVVNSPQVHAQNLISNGGFDNGLTDWTQASWAGGSSFGINANGPANTSAASGNYAYAGGGAYNLLQQNISGITAGNAYRLTFLAGAKSGQAANGVLSLFDGLAGSYNSASFDYNPSDAAFGSYTVDFTARGATDLWLRSDSTYAAYDNVSVTAIGSVANALNYSSASGYSQIKSALTGSGKVTVNAGTGGLSLIGANTHTGGTEVTGGTLFVAGAGTLGAASGNVTVTGTGGSEVKLDLRNQQTLTGTITMTGDNARIIAGDANNVGSLVNNGSIQFGGGKLAVAVSGSGGINVTGGGTIDSSNSYTGATTISGTTGWYGTGQLFVNNANALGAASGDLTVSGGYVNLQANTITRSGNVTVSGGRIENGTLSKSGSNYDIQGGSVGASLAGTAGLTKSGSATAALGGANTYFGGTTINGGTLSVYSAGGLGDAAGAVTVNTGSTLYTHSGLTISRTGDVTVNGGSLSTDNANMGTISVSGGNFIANNAAVLAVKLAGTAGLTVGGTGETYLWTDSSYTGATVISSGTLTLGGSGAISNQSRLQIDSGAAVNLTGAYAADNINRTFAGLTGAGVLYGGGGTVTINKASGTDTFSGDIQGAQGLIKAGAGDLALAASNTYTGNTSVTAGRLAVAHNNALGSTAGGTTVANGAQLYLNGVTVGNEALTISGNGLASGSSIAGALRSGTGSNTYQGKVTLAADAKIFSGSGTSMTLDVASGDAVDLASHTLTIEGSGTHTVNDGITGTGGLTKIGSGTTTLAAANSYSGATAVNAGLLKVLSGGSISSSSTTVNTGGTFDVGGTAGNVQVNSGGLLKGSGSVGAFTLASGGTLTPGNSPGTLTAASATILGGSTYNWEISALTGTAGTTWDLFSVGGLLDMSGVTSGNKWNLVVTGDSGFTGWTDTSSYSYVFAQAASVSGFSSTVGTDVTSLFNITTSGIASKPNASFNVNGDFKVVVGSANGVTTLNLMAVPEPSTGSMMGLGLAGLVVTRLLRRKSS
jgi:autotransporter-associated beta strand protein